MTEPCYLRRGRLRAWIAPGVDLEHTTAADGDPDHLLTRPDGRIVKPQRKVVVGRVETAAGALWVKRYAVYAWRVVLASLWRTSPAFGAWAGARALAAHGFATPEPIAAIEFRRAGLLRRSFFVTREVAGAVTADVRWRSILADPDARRRRAARRALACALGDLFRRLHAAGLYHNDLKDVNVLTDGPAAAPRLVLLDLERVRALGRVGRRRRVKNVVQLARTLGRQASATDRVRFLAAYLGGTSTRAERRAWTAAVARRARRKDRGRRPAPAPDGPTVTCTVVCQDEEAHMVPGLESVTWCDEIVVVPGRLVPAPRGAPGAAGGDALGRDGSARAGRGEGAGGAAPPAHPAPQLRRHLGPPAQPEQADGRGRRAAAPPATGRRLAPDRGARVALRARLSRQGRRARRVPRTLRSRDRRVLRVPPLGQGARAARARESGRGLTPRGPAPTSEDARAERAHEAGHEVGSHGYAHQLVDRQAPDEFAAELGQG